MHDQILEFLDSYTYTLVGDCVERLIGGESTDAEKVICMGVDLGFRG